MRIDRFSRIDTLTYPGRFLCTVHVSMGDEPGMEPSEVMETIVADRDSLDGMAVTASGCDVLAIPSVHRLIREIRPKGLSLSLVTPGSSPDALDDLIGAGYVNHVILQVTGPLDRDQERCIEIVRDHGCPYNLDIMMAPGRIDEDSLRPMATLYNDCARFVMRTYDPRKHGGILGNEKFKDKDAASLARSVKGLVRNATFL